MTRSTDRTAGRPSVVLLVQTTQGATVAVRFPTVKAARDWEDEHGVQAEGVVSYVSGFEALRLAGVR